MTYFFDNCISYRYAHMLRALDVPSVALRDIFPPTIEDDELLEQLRGTDYVFVSSEQRMQRHPLEARLLKHANITALFFGRFWSNMLFWDQAKWLITRWQTIDGFVQGAEKGTLARVQQNGRSRTFQL